MNPCRAPIAFEVLIEYWLSELNQARESQVEEHLMGCGECAAALGQVAALAAGIRRSVRNSAVAVVVTGDFLKRLAADGLRVREYRVPCNGSVQCTVAPDDDVLVGRMQAQLVGIEQLDVVGIGAGGEELYRMRDVLFDPSGNEVVVTPRIEPIRSGPAHTARRKLVAVSGTGERTIGEYTYHHSPWQSAGQ